MTNQTFVQVVPARSWSGGPTGGWWVEVDGRIEREEDGKPMVWMERRYAEAYAKQLRLNQKAM